MRRHRPTGFWRLGRHPVVSRWISCSGALDSSESRNATHLLWLCVLGGTKRTQGQFWLWWNLSECVLHLVLPLTPLHPHFTPLPQQSLNDKRKKNLFTRKFPFYKSREASEQETSDVERKYRRRREAGRAAAGLSVRPSVRPFDRQTDRQAGRLVSDRKRSQLVVGPHLVQSPQQIPPTPPHVEPNSRSASGAAAPTPLLSVCRWRSVTLFPLVVFSCSLGCADVRTTVTTRCPNTTVSPASPWPSSAPGLQRRHLLPLELKTEDTIRFLVLAHWS